MTERNIIAAYESNRGIGYEDDMPWGRDLPADLRHFKELTSGHTIVMGRKTYDSIGRPLPNRRNVVLTSQEDLDIEGCEVVNSLDEALDISADEEEIFIIGGASLYRVAMPEADRLFITEVTAYLPADTYFPEINPDQWSEISREHHQADENNKYNYTFVEYERIR